MNSAGFLRVLLLAMASLIAFASTFSAAATGDAVEQELAQRAKLEQAQKLIDSRKSAEALPLIDQILTYYIAKYPEGKTRWYVSRTTEESVLYMSQATFFDKNRNDPGKTEATTLNVAWAEAYFLKAFAHVELGQQKQAVVAIERALTLSPSNAKYLIERAELDKLTRNWDEAYRLYQEAETASQVSPTDEKAGDKSHAMRGQAFVLIEQGKLDAAKRELEACLKLDRNDVRAKHELQYIEQLRAEKP